MEKIDGHLHLVQTIAGFNRNGRLNALGKGAAIWDTGERLQLIPEGYGDHDFTAENALRLLETAGVKRAVLLQGSLNGYQNQYTAAMIKKYPERFAGAFAVDPFAAEMPQIVAYHLDELGFRHFKLEMSAGGGLSGYHAPFNLATEPKIRYILDQLAVDPGATVTIDYGSVEQVSHQPEAVVTLAQEYPQLNFVVAHLSFPAVGDMERLKSELQLWQPYPNIYTDLSAIQDILGETGQPFTHSREAVVVAQAVLGAKRLIWGSDAPLSAALNAYTDLASWLETSGLFTEAELADVYQHNAEWVYFN